MGLDQRLYRKQYGKPAEDGDQVLLGVRSHADPGSSEEHFHWVEIGYWRKANQIHHWFVENVQKGVDDCGAYVVSRRQLSDLLDLVNEVLATLELAPGRVLAGQTGEGDEGFHTMRPGYVVKDATVAAKLLPTREGYFFGSPDYDSWYFEGLVVTKCILESELRNYPSREFLYQANW